MKINENILISSLTTMRLGGPARYVIEVENRDEVADAYDFAEQANLPTFVLGYGANTIGHDEGFNGVIIINRMKGIEITQTPTDILNSKYKVISDQAPSSEEKIADDSGASFSETMMNDRDPSSEGPKTWASAPERPEEKGSGRSSIFIKAMGGEYWDDVVDYACKRGLTGIEALSKIPGLAGAAPVQNIGAYGQEIADTLVEIEVYDTTDHTYKTLKKSDLHFSYRKSILNTTEKNRYFVISITLQLSSGEMSRPFYNSIEQYMTVNNITDCSPKSIRQIVSDIRTSKLPDPLSLASSGSFFKNIYLNDADAKLAESKGYPVYRGKDGNKINSGWLIEQAGLKGALLHGMRVSDKAPLVLINESAKSYDDLKSARSEIVGKVYDKFGYWLEQEPMEIQ